MLNLFELAGTLAAAAAAQQSGLLQALLNGPETSPAYASKLCLDPIATERVLDVLVHSRVADRQGNLYGASEALKHLEAKCPGGLAGFTALWSQTPAFLRFGRRVAQMDGPPDAREASYRTLVPELGELFCSPAKQLAERMTGSPHILDVGAGSGVWSLAMAARHPAARVTALDLPGVLPAFERRALELGLSDRTETVAGDFHRVELPAGRFDRVLLANVLHLETREHAERLVRRAAGWLPSNGQLVIVDFIGDGSPLRERARAIYGLHLALRTASGRAYPFEDIVEWATAAGLVPEDFVALDCVPGALGAFVARKP